ncbi:DUF6596 domain-containing protein [Paenarthrobacter sp. PH39-S1]|uniref:RNA polymerase sigma factor n=1 Tax=Paenarthrobacter sp. PH39-S1 TaxID=3046204 RepID=UPI0024BB4DC8|nr:DUF6596 domain-containing protein [Paenarthrobacter sp. PH39-S1]MDJ0356659.1 sigma factor-like helix-turn-helix DNA-binding protein [Paenarthrobacter sp. PH39-S1]
MSDADDTLDLLYHCCHPALNASAQVALTLRALGGLTTAEIAAAFLIPEPTMAQRISRAKQRIRATGLQIAASPEARSERTPSVLHVLYLIFTEGHTASSGKRLYRVDLTDEAIRLERQLHQLLPNDGEVTGLLALMLLIEARREARSPDGSTVIPLGNQDRTRWNTSLIAEGTTLISQSLSKNRLGPYQVQAAIAAVHDQASQAEDTDWDEIVQLYDLLLALTPSPTVALNRTIAVAMTCGAQIGLQTLAQLQTEYRLSDLHRLEAVRAHLLEMAGDAQAAQIYYRAAARRTSSIPEQRHLLAKAHTLTQSIGHDQSLTIRRNPGNSPVIDGQNDGGFTEPGLQHLEVNPLTCCEGTVSAGERSLPTSEMITE